MGQRVRLDEREILRMRVDGAEVDTQQGRAPQQRVNMGILKPGKKRSAGEINGPSSGRNERSGVGPARQNPAIGHCHRTTIPHPVSAIHGPVMEDQIRDGTTRMLTQFPPARSGSAIQWNLLRHATPISGSPFDLAVSRRRSVDHGPGQGRRRVREGEFGGRAYAVRGKFFLMVGCGQ